MAEKIIKSNGSAPRRGDIIISPIYSDIVWRLLRAELSDFVYLYTIKGNLRYRIEKLGIEEGYDRTDEQKYLCKAADMQRDAAERMERMSGSSQPLTPTMLRICDLSRPRLVLASSQTLRPSLVLALLCAILLSDHGRIPTRVQHVDLHT